MEEILSGQENVLGGCGSLRVEREAQRLAEQLLARQGSASPAEVPEAAAPVEVHSIEVDSLTLIRRRLHEQGINDRWSSLHEILAGQVRVTATFRRPDGRALHVRKATQAEPEQLRIYQALKINPSPGGVTKMLV